MNRSKRKPTVNFFRVGQKAPTTITVDGKRTKKMCEVEEINKSGIDAKIFVARGRKKGQDLAVARTAGPGSDVITNCNRTLTDQQKKAAGTTLRNLLWEKGGKDPKKERAALKEKEVAKKFERTQRSKITKANNAIKRAEKMRAEAEAALKGGSMPSARKATTSKSKSKYPSGRSTIKIGGKSAKPVRGVYPTSGKALQALSKFNASGKKGTYKKIGEGQFKIFQFI